MNNDKNTTDPKLVGTFRLVSNTIEVQDTGEKISAPWNGRMIVQPDGKFALIMTKAGRTAPVTEEDRAVAYTTVTAVSGTTTMDGEDSVVTYDLASIPTLLGSHRITNKEIDGRLHITAAWRQMPQLGNRSGRTITLWERE